jgi:hypothetical protein
MPRSAATERETAGRPVTIHAPGFIGREPELAALVRSLACDPSVILVEGEAGVGKTRLLQEFLASQAVSGGGVLLACCPPLQTPHTLGPVVDALRQATAHPARLGLSALSGALRPLFPEWAADLSPAPEPPGDASAARHQVFCALAEVLSRLGARVLVVEDAHWADEATLEFLLFPPPAAGEPGGVLPPGGRVAGLPAAAAVAAGGGRHRAPPCAAPAGRGADRGPDVLDAGRRAGVGGVRGLRARAHGGPAAGGGGIGPGDERAGRPGPQPPRLGGPPSGRHQCPPECARRGAGTLWAAGPPTPRLCWRQRRCSPSPPERICWPPWPGSLLPGCVPACPSRWAAGC